MDTKEVIREEAELKGYEIIDIYPCDSDYVAIYNSLHSETHAYTWDMRGIEGEYEGGLSCNEGLYCVETVRWREKEAEK